MDDQLYTEIDKYVEQLREKLHQEADRWAETRTPGEMMKVEQELSEMENTFHTEMVGAVVESIHRDQEFVSECQGQAWEQGLRNVEWREVKVRTLGEDEMKSTTTG